MQRFFRRLPSYGCTNLYLDFQFELNKDTREIGGQLDSSRSIYEKFFPHNKFCRLVEKQYQAFETSLTTQQPIFSKIKITLTGKYRGKNVYESFTKISDYVTYAKVLGWTVNENLKTILSHALEKEGELIFQKIKLEKNDAQPVMRI